jgi:hypothetical protein
VGRDIGQISSREINVPAGRGFPGITFRTADAGRDSKLTFCLVNPNGNVVATATAASRIHKAADHPWTGGARTRLKDL